MDGFATAIVDGLALSSGSETSNKKHRSAATTAASANQNRVARSDDRLHRTACLAVGLLLGWSILAAPARGDDQPVRADFVLVIDKGGSMIKNDPQARARRTALEVFLRQAALCNSVRVGFVKFSDNVLPQDKGQLIRLPHDEAQLAAEINRFLDFETKGATNFVIALREALSVLGVESGDRESTDGADNRFRAVVFLTDGNVKIRESDFGKTRQMLEPKDAGSLSPWWSRPLPIEPPEPSYVLGPVIRQFQEHNVALFSVPITPLLYPDTLDLQVQMQLSKLRELLTTLESQQYRQVQEELSVLQQLLRKSNVYHDEHVRQRLNEFRASLDKLKDDPHQQVQRDLRDLHDLLQNVFQEWPDGRQLLGELAAATPNGKLLNRSPDLDFAEIFGWILSSYMPGKVSLRPDEDGRVSINPLYSRVMITGYHLDDIQLAGGDSIQLAGSDLPDASSLTADGIRYRGKRFDDGLEMLVIQRPGPGATATQRANWDGFWKVKTVLPAVAARIQVAAFTDLEFCWHRQLAQPRWPLETTPYLLAYSRPPVGDPEVDSWIDQASAELTGRAFVDDVENPGKVEHLPDLNQFTIVPPQSTVSYFLNVVIELARHGHVQEIYGVRRMRVEVAPEDPVYVEGYRRNDKGNITIGQPDSENLVFGNAQEKNPTVVADTLIDVMVAPRSTDFSIESVDIQRQEPVPYDVPQEPQVNPDITDFPPGAFHLLLRTKSLTEDVDTGYLKLAITGNDERSLSLPVPLLQVTPAPPPGFPWWWPIPALLLAFIALVVLLDRINRPKPPPKSPPCPPKTPVLTTPKPAPCPPTTAVVTAQPPPCPPTTAVVTTPQPPPCPPTTPKPEEPPPGEIVPTEPPGPPQPYGSHDEHLRDELRRMHLLAHAETIRWRKAVGDKKPSDRWGMAGVTNSEVDAFLSTAFGLSHELAEGKPDRADRLVEEACLLRERIDARLGLTSQDPDMYGQLRIQQLQDRLQLAQPDRDLVLICLLPEVEEQYRRLFGYLQDDATRDLPDVDLVRRILSPVVPAAEVRAALAAERPLMTRRIVSLLGDEVVNGQSLATRSVRIDDHIVSWLTGSDEPDARLTRFVEPVEPLDWEELDFTLHAPEVDRLELLTQWLHNVGNGTDSPVTLFFHGPPDSGRRKAARAMTTRLSRQLLQVDVAAALRTGMDWQLLVDLCYRTATLHYANLYWAGSELLLSDESSEHSWAYLIDAAKRFPDLTWLESTATWEPTEQFLGFYFLRHEFRLPDYSIRSQIWQRYLPQLEHFAAPLPDRGTLTELLADSFQLSETQIIAAIESARTQAFLRDPHNNGLLTPDDLQQACRQQSGRRLVNLARRIEPGSERTFDDLIVPDSIRRQLVELRDRIRNRSRVNQSFGFERRLRLGKGLVALFSGSSGTGKTMAAELLANDQGVDLYKVDLAALVSKYVGETEKNLRQIFAEAENSNAIIFFDEADSLFSKRGEVREARDRWANLETNYLLQRIEEFSGVVILATNLRRNIDEAFQRRVQTVLEFPFPNASSRAIFLRTLPKHDLFQLDLELEKELPQSTGDEVAVTRLVRRAFTARDAELSDDSAVSKRDGQWAITDEGYDLRYEIRKARTALFVSKRNIEPRDDEIEALAERFELPGGSIKNIVVDAAFRAFTEKRPQQSVLSDGCAVPDDDDQTEPEIKLRHLVAATAREYQKLGRGVTESEFGSLFFKWIREDIRGMEPVPQ